jgi:hypothetical protein
MRPEQFSFSDYSNIKFRKFTYVEHKEPAQEVPKCGLFGLVQQLQLQKSWPKPL